MAIPKLTEMERELARQIAHRLAQMMDELDLNQSELAKKIGASQSTVSDLLHPKKHRLPTGLYILRIIDVLGISPSWFLYGVGGKHWREKGDDSPQVQYVRGELAALGKMTAALEELKEGVLQENTSLLTPRLAQALESATLAAKIRSSRDRVAAKRPRGRRSAG
jgi:transcriptional regulator with XRE-family HTH domain